MVNFIGNRLRSVAVPAVTVFAVLALSCGAPLGPVPFAWVKKAELPGGYSGPTIYGVGSRGVYCNAAADDGRDVLLVYDGTAFTESYALEQSEGIINSGGFAGDYGFITLLRVSGLETEPCLMEIRGGNWHEVYRSSGHQSFQYPIPLGVDTCWLVANEKEPSDVYRITKYEKGELKVYGETDQNSPVALSRAAGLFYYFPRGADGKRLNITADGGATWREENIKVPVPYEITRVRDIAASPQTLYVAVEVEVAGINSPYYAILKRSGPAGEGIYDFSYVAWTGPGFLQLDALAFRADDDGVAVGTGASIYSDGRDWIREVVDPNFGFKYLVPDERGGYWAMDRYNEVDFLWHP